MEKVKQYNRNKQSQPTSFLLTFSKENKNRKSSNSPLTKYDKSQ